MSGARFGGKLLLRSVTVHYVTHILKMPVSGRISQWCPVLGQSSRLNELGFSTRLFWEYFVKLTYCAFLIRLGQSPRHITSVVSHSTWQWGEVREFPPAEGSADGRRGSTRFPGLKKQKPDFWKGSGLWKSIHTQLVFQKSTQENQVTIQDLLLALAINQYFLAKFHQTRTALGYSNYYL